MKKILLLLIGMAGLASPFLANAQVTSTFTVAQDTVPVTALINGGSALPTDDITNIIPSSRLVIKWDVIACNFPASWLTSAAFGICDNINCFNNIDSHLWNGTSGTTYKSNPYIYDVAGNFNLDLSLPTVADSGSYYVTIALTDSATGYTKDITFGVSNTVTAVPNIINPNEEVLLYPNPATNDVNVVWDANTDVKNIAIYNIIGKVMTMYRVAGNSANLNLDNVPSGIYFVRLINSHGDPVVTGSLQNNKIYFCI